ncbi:uncharacterized protein METZ01_LOCUS441759 [marine metagenome]|uniref:Uncharacterized protein n=1 Tax=marine metagenome TaxID=408172 RepID=A0A382Z1D6_9ZZZZ
MIGADDVHLGAQTKPYGFVWTSYRGMCSMQTCHCW